MDYEYRKGDKMIKEYIDLVSKLTSYKPNFLKKIYKKFLIIRFKKFLYSYLFSSKILLIQNLFDFSWITTVLNDEVIGTEKNNLSIRYYKSNDDISRDIVYYQFKSENVVLDLKIISDMKSFSTDLSVIYMENKNNSIKKTISITNDRIYFNAHKDIYSMLKLIICSYIDLLVDKLMEM